MPKQLELAVKRLEEFNNDTSSWENKHFDDEGDWNCDWACDWENWNSNQV